MAEADPQASVLAKLTGLDISQTVRTALTIFVALLIEIGSGVRHVRRLQPTWRLGDQLKKPSEEVETGIWQRSESIRPTVRQPPARPPSRRRSKRRRSGPTTTRATTTRRPPSRWCPTATCSVSTERGSLEHRVLPA